MSFAKKGVGRILTAAAVALLAVSGTAVADGFGRIDGWIANSASYPIGGSFLKVQWTDQTGEQDLVGYSRLVRDEGEQALYAALGGKELGRLSIDGEIGRPIAIVHETRKGGMTRLVIVVERDLSPLLRFTKSDAFRYPYMVFDVTLDADGAGIGEIHPEARLAVSPDGKFSYETQAPLPLRVLQIEAS
jgi:hypothetical protein